MRCGGKFTAGASALADIWYSDTARDFPPLTPLGWTRVIRRGAPLLLLVGAGLLVHGLIRLVEWPICGPRRPVTPHVTQFVCRTAFAILGIGYETTGNPMRDPGAVVANHCSWLDIFALNARKRIYFVAKEEVAGWSGIGWLARATGTVFIKRDRRDVHNQIAIFRQRLTAGHKLLFFPEGTTTDGLRVLDFKPALFAAFFDPALAPKMQLQAVTLDYSAPPGEDPRFYGWWGDMDFGPHLLAVLSARKQGRISVRYHAPVRLTDFNDRKAIAKTLEKQVRAGLSDHRSA